MMNSGFVRKGISLVACMAFLAGCTIDKDYDGLLDKDIDTEANLLKGIVMPLGSFKKITLDDFVEIGDDKTLVCDEEGFYYIKASFRTLTYDYKMPEIPFDIKGYSGIFPVVNAPVPAVGTEVTVPVALNYSISEDVWGFPREIKALDYIDVDEEFVFNLSFDCFGQKNAYGKVVIAAGSVVNMPSWINITGCNTSGMTVTSAHSLVFDEDVQLSSSKDFVIKCQVGRLGSFINSSCSVEDGGRFHVDGNVEVKGDLKLLAGNAEGEDAEVVLYFGIGPKTAKVKGGRIQFEPSYARPQFDDISVNLGEFPDFFFNEDSDIRLKDVYAYMDVDSRFPVDFNFFTNVNAYSGKDVTWSFSVENPGVPIHAKSQTHILYSEFGLDKPNLFNCRIKDFSRAMSPIPDRVEMLHTSCTMDDEWAEVVPKADYGVSANAYIDVPLALAEGSRVRFVQVLDDLKLDLGKDIWFAEAEVSLELVNSIPFSVEVAADILDADGEIMPGVTLEVDGTVAAGSIAQPNSGPVTIRIKTDGKLDFDGIQLKVIATAGPDGARLNRYQGVELRNIKIRLPEGINVTL